MKALWTYTLARLGVFALTYAVFWGVGQSFLEFGSLTNLLVLLAAMIVSSIISIFALSDLREKLAVQVQERAERMNERVEESRRAEDVD